METEDIFGFVILLFVALVMETIGISQLLSKKPVGFYTGEKPPEINEITDVKAWNTKHGFMWVLYGIFMIICYFIGLAIGDTLISAIPMCGGVIFPIFFMIWYHKRLVKHYHI